MNRLDIEEVEIRLKPDHSRQLVERGFVHFTERVCKCPPDCICCDIPNVSLWGAHRRKVTVTLY